MTHTIRFHITGPNTDRRGLLALQDSLWLGRDPNCDLVLPSEQVSRRHVALFQAAGQLQILDHSSNGTWLDGHRLPPEQQPLPSRAALKIGPYEVAVQGVATPPSSVGGQQSSPSHRAGRLALTPRPEEALKEAEHRGRAPLPGQSPPARIPRRKSHAVEHTTQPPPVSRPAQDGTPDATTQPSTTPDHAGSPLDLQCEPLAQLLADPSVQAVVAIGTQVLQVERDGRMEQTGTQLPNRDALEQVVARITQHLGVQGSANRGAFGGHLGRGLVAHVLQEPWLHAGPCLTLRKLPACPVTAPDLVKHGVISADILRFLQGAIRLGKTVLISGLPGSGKSGMVGALAHSLPNHERIVTLGQGRALNLPQPYQINLDLGPTTPPPATLTRLLKELQYMGADRLVVDLPPGVATLALLRAFHSGMPALATVEGTCPLAALHGLQGPSADGQPATAPQLVQLLLNQLAPIIVQLVRGPSGQPYATEVAEVCPGADQTRPTEARPLYLRAVGPHGSKKQRSPWSHTAYSPSFVDQLRQTEWPSPRGRAPATDPQA